MKRIAMLLAGASLAGSTAVATAAPVATAATTTAALPKIQHFGMGGSWTSSFRIRPSLVAFGAHFEIKDLHYSHYGSRSATASGRLAIDDCIPNCAQGGHFVNASAVFYKAASHRGPGRYYSNLNLAWRHNTRHIHLWIDSRGEWIWHGA